MAYKIKLTYLDGAVEEVFPAPRARIETERHFGGLGQSNVQEATFYMAWIHLSKSGKTQADFDTWVDSLADLEELQIPEPRPTPQAQPDGTSSS